MKRILFILSKLNYMKNFSSFCLIIFSSFLYSQNIDQAIAQGHYKRQVSNAAYEKALNDMQTSAKRSTDEKLNQLDERFELNFIHNEKFKSKLNMLQQKKMNIESEIERSNSVTEKRRLSEKVGAFNLEIEKVSEKLKANENELKLLQESYKNLLK